MEQKQNASDKGLRTALSKQTTHRLASNFTFRTMLKVEELVSKKEKREEKTLFLTIVATSLLLLIAGGITIHLYWEETLRNSCADLLKTLTIAKEESLTYGIFSLIVFILMTFDYWMRKIFRQRKE